MAGFRPKTVDEKKLILVEIKLEIDFAKILQKK